MYITLDNFTNEGCKQQTTRTELLNYLYLPRARRKKKKLYQHGSTRHLASSCEMCARISLCSRSLARRGTCEIVSRNTASGEDRACRGASVYTRFDALGEITLYNDLLPALWAPKRRARALISLRKTWSGPVAVEYFFEYSWMCVCFFFALGDVVWFPGDWSIFLGFRYVWFLGFGGL